MENPTVLSGDFLYNDTEVSGSDCLYEHATPGCDDVACQSAVCALQSDCCASGKDQAQWDLKCADLAHQYCCNLLGNRCDNSRHVLSADHLPQPATLDGLSVVAGRADDGPGYLYLFGGGAFVSGGKLVLTDCAFRENYAWGGGGGVYLNVADLVAVRSTWTGNRGAQGAAISGLYSSIDLTGADMQQNQTVLSVLDLSDGSLILRESTVSRNEGAGAAVFALWSTVDIEGAALADNEFLGLNLYRSPATITRTDVARNDGGGIRYWGTFLSLSDSIVHDNRSNSDYAGGLTIDPEGPVYVDRCTFARNDTDNNEGGGINFWNAASVSPLYLTNTILWANTAVSNPRPAVQIAANNRSYIHASSCIVQDWNAPYLPGVGMLDADPLFVSPSGPDNIPATPDDDFHLYMTSPAINVGDPSALVSPDSTDLDGSPRLSGCRVDLGAYETPHTQPHGDFNADGRTDLGDLSAFIGCLDGSGGLPTETCLCVFDMDSNGAVDLRDYAQMGR